MLELHWGLGPYARSGTSRGSVQPMERPVRIHGLHAVPDPAPAARGGRPPTGRVQKERGMLRLDDETFDKLNRYAEAMGKSRAVVIRDAITHYIAGCDDE